MRRFVIGDIHGCMKSLRTLIDRIAPQPDDELILLGDYVDRGPDSRDVVDQLIQLRDRCQMVALRGNHEIMLQGVVIGGLDPGHWLESGGLATLTSYGGAVSKIPHDHLAFFRSLLPFYETDKEIFIHASYEAHLPMDEQREEVMYWTHLGTMWPAPHVSGKRVFVGHTPQPLGNILDIGYLVCLDTYCFGRGYLTAMDLDTYELIQVDYYGHVRRDNSSAFLKWLGKQWNKVSKRIVGPQVEKRESDSPIQDSSCQPDESGATKSEDSDQNLQPEANGVP